MKTLVTGGAGFIGSNLADALLNAGHEVTVIDNLSSGKREQVPPAAGFHLMDITDSTLAYLLKTDSPEVVFHLAAQIDVRRSVADPVFDTQMNVVGTVNLLQACTDAGVRRLVFTSSGGAIYGDTEILPTSEEHDTNPQSPYGTAKWCGELYGNLFAQLYGLEFVTLRPANVYGPRQDPHGEAGVVAIFAEQLLLNQVPSINGDGEQTRDFVYVDDVVQANLLAATSSSLGAFNIGTAKQTDINQLYARLADICGIEALASHQVAKTGEQQHSCLDIQRAQHLLGWEPKVELTDGLERTVHYFRSMLRPA